MNESQELPSEEIATASGDARVLDEAINLIEGHCGCLGSEQDLCDKLREIQSKLSNEVSSEEIAPSVAITDLAGLPTPYEYPSGFKVGERVKVLPGERKHNNHVKLDWDGNPNATIQYYEGLALGGQYLPESGESPDDAVYIVMDNGGHGSVDADKLERI